MSKVKFYFVGLIFFLLFCIPLPEFSISYSLVCKIFPSIAKSYVIESQNDENDSCLRCSDNSEKSSNAKKKIQQQNSEKKIFQLNNTRYKFDYIKVKKKFFDNVVIKFHNVKIFHNVISSENMNVYSKNLRNMMNMLENHQDNELLMEDSLSKNPRLSNGKTEFANENDFRIGDNNELRGKNDLGEKNYLVKKMKKTEKRLEARLMRYDDNLHDSSYCIDVKNLYAGFSIVKILSYTLMKKNNFSSMKNAIHEVDCEELKITKMSNLRNASKTTNTSQEREKNDNQFVLKKFSYKTQIIPFDKKFGFAIYFILNKENYLIKGLHYDHAIDLQLSIHNVPILYVYYDFLNHIFSSKFGFKKLYDHEVFLANGILNFSPDSVNCDFNLRINNFSVRAKCQDNLLNFKNYSIDDFLSQRNELKKDHLKRSRFHNAVTKLRADSTLGPFNKLDTYSTLDTSNINFSLKSGVKNIRKNDMTDVSIHKDSSEKNLPEKDSSEKNSKTSSDTIYLLLNMRNLSFTDVIKYLFDKDHFLLPIAVLFFDKLIDLLDGIVTNINFESCNALIVFNRSESNSNYNSDRNYNDFDKDSFSEQRKENKEDDKEKENNDQSTSDSLIVDKSQLETSKNYNQAYSRSHNQSDSKNHTQTHTKNYNQSSAKKLGVSDFFVEYKNLIIDLSFDGLDIGYLKGSGHFDTNTFIHEMDYAALNGFAIGHGFVKMTDIDWFAFRDSIIEVSSEIITENVISIISTFVKDEKLKRFLNRLGGAPMNLSFLGNLTQDNGLVFWIGANLDTFILRNEFVFEDFIKFKDVEIICELNNEFQNEFQDREYEGFYIASNNEFHNEIRSEFENEMIEIYKDSANSHNSADSMNNKAHSMKNLHKNLKNKETKPKILRVKGRGNNFFFESIEKLKTSSVEDSEKNSMQNFTKDDLKDYQKNESKYETFFETVVRLKITAADLYNLGINLTNYLDAQSILDVEVRHCDRNDEDYSKEKYNQKKNYQNHMSKNAIIQIIDGVEGVDKIEEIENKSKNRINPWQVFVSLKDCRVYISPMNYYKDFGNDLYVQFSSVDFLFIDDFKIFTFINSSAESSMENFTEIFADSSASLLKNKNTKLSETNQSKKTKGKYCKNNKARFIIASGSMILNKYSDLMEMHLKTFYFKNAYYKLSEKAEITAVNYSAIGIDFKMKNIFNNRTLNVESGMSSINTDGSNIESSISNVEARDLPADSTDDVTTNNKENKTIDMNSGGDEILGNELLSNCYEVSIEVGEFSLDELIHDLIHEKHDKPFNPAVKSLLKIKPVTTVNYIKIHLPKLRKEIYTDFTFRRRLSKNNSNSKNNSRNSHEYLIAMLAEKVTLSNTILTFAIQYNVDGSIGLNNFHGTGKFFHEFEFHDDFIDLKNIDHKYSSMSKNLKKQIKKYHFNTEKYISNMVKYYYKSKESSMFLSLDKETNVINMFFDNAGVVLRFFGISKAFLNGIMSINFDINHVNEFLSSLSKNAPKLNMNKPHMKEYGMNNKLQPQELQQKKPHKVKSQQVYNQVKFQTKNIQQNKVNQKGLYRSKKGRSNTIIKQNHENKIYKNKMFYFPVHVKILDANMEIKKSNFFFKILYSGLSLFVIKRMFDKFFSVDLNTFVMLSNKEILVKSFYINLLDVCITGEGVLNFQEKTIVNWSGEIMPFYYLSKIVNLLYIKPFNDLINPDGHGIISMKYFASGDIKSPNIKVNPLSIFLFRGFK